MMMFASEDMKRSRMFMNMFFASLYSCSWRVEYSFRSGLRAMPRSTMSDQISFSCMWDTESITTQSHWCGCRSM